MHVPRGLRGRGAPESPERTGWAAREELFPEPLVHACLLCVCRVPGPGPGMRKAGSPLQMVTSQQWGGANAQAACLGAKGFEGVTALLSREFLGRGRGAALRRDGQQWGMIRACDCVTDVPGRTHRKVASKPGVALTATCHGQAPGFGSALGHETSSSGDLCADFAASWDSITVS